MTRENVKLILLICIIFSGASFEKVFSQFNWKKVGKSPSNYEIAPDSSNQLDGQVAYTLKSSGVVIEGFGAIIENLKPGTYLGKRIRMTGMMKSKGVEGWAGFWLRIDQSGSDQFLAFDNMHDRPVKGTTEWKKYEIVLDVPYEATNIAFGALIDGMGQIWIAKVNLEIVDNSVPTTDIRN